MTVPRVTAFIGLGGNSGEVTDTLHAVSAALANLPGVQFARMSRLLETRPVTAAGVSAATQPTYINAVAQLETTLGPLDLLDSLQSLELQFGRLRQERWGARTLDLDLLFYGDQILDTPRLTVPHTAAWYRRFVLDPLVEIAPNFIHPVKQTTMRDLRDRLLRRPVKICLAGLDPGPAGALIGVLQHEYPSVTFEAWDAQDDPMFIVWLGDPQDPAFGTLPRVPRVMPYGPVTDGTGFARVLIASAGLV